MARLQIECVGIDASAGTRSLFRWLRDDPATRRELTVALDAYVPAESMGALDVVSVILTQATSIGSFAVAYASWRDSRSHRPTTRITLNTNSVEVTTESAEQLATVVSDLVEQLPDSRE